MHDFIVSAPHNSEISSALTVKILKCHPDAQVPTYATPGAACFDFYSIEDAEVGTLNTSHVFRTGLKFEIPEGWVMMIFSRSGHGFKNDIRLANCVGIIDSDYRGEVMVKLTSDRMRLNEIFKGDRIAQGMLVPVLRVQFTVSEAILSSDRGEGGFGSTGR